MNRPPAFQYGQRVERFGFWHPYEEGDWVFGHVVGFGSANLVFKDNNGVTHTVSTGRAQWKPSLSAWSVWAPWVGAVVLHIEADEKKADTLGVGHLRLTPLLGDFVMVHVGAKGHPGFIGKMNGDWVLVSKPPGRPGEPQSYSIRRSALMWDHADKHWRARADAKQERR